MTLAAVVVSHNSARFLPDCLQSLQSQTRPCAEIVVVDCASGDGSARLIAAAGVTPLLLGYNAGYAAAANLGIARCRADLVLVANADCRFDGQFVEKATAAFTRQPDLGLLSPLILRFDGETIDSAGQERSAALFPREAGWNRPRSAVDLRPRPVFSVCGAATVFSRRALERLALEGEWYDSDFFMFWEDFDIGWRAQRLGLRVAFDPGPQVRHFRSATLPSRRLARLSLAMARPAGLRFHLVKNRYLTLLKNFRWRDDWRALPFMLLRDPLWVAALTLTAPANIIRLCRSGELFRRALRKRRRLRDHE